MSMGPHFVLSRFPAPWNLSNVELIPQQSGWSGGQVWQVQSGQGAAALRCWPAGFPVERIAAIHRLQQLANAGHCPFIPQIIPCFDGTTTLIHENQAWELATWMPGTPASVAGPSHAQLRGTGNALAAWHRSLHPDVAHQSARVLTSAEMMSAFLAREKSPSPGIRRRISEWRRLISLFHDRHAARIAPEFVALTARTEAAMEKHSGSIGLLELWANRPLELVVSLPDLHRDHVLFENEVVTGIIDFGGVTIDTPAMELVRYASSFEGGRDAFQANVRRLLESYREQKPLSWEVDQLVLPLAVSSLAIGMLHWWEWLAIDGKRFSGDPLAAVNRWEMLIRQLEVWPADGIP